MDVPFVHVGSHETSQQPVSHECVFLSRRVPRYDRWTLLDWRIPTRMGYPGHAVDVIGLRDQQDDANEQRQHFTDLAGCWADYARHRSLLLSPNDAELPMKRASVVPFPSTRWRPGGILAAHPSDLCEMRQPVITAEDIVPLRGQGEDAAEMERLCAKFAQVRVARRPFVLTAGEFEDILKWKLRGQYVRQRVLREANTELLVRAVTQAALAIRHDDPEYALELRFGILCTMRGVGVPVASAALGLVNPHEYAVIDYRGWRQIFGGEQTAFTIPDYKRYLRQIRGLAETLAWSLPEVDLAIWEFDRRQGGKDS